ncbi:hypothetical protein [Staphylococcus shinii]|uniref:hypothetical protein n=1 Tax=Staphylococcus shinii TaxID=2912228 RepID=UPI003F83B588
MLLDDYSGLLFEFADENVNKLGDIKQYWMLLFIMEAFYIVAYKNMQITHQAPLSEVSFLL